jgi:hypothetical protein
MNSLKFNFLIALLFTVNFLFGQIFQRGTITFTNGESRTGNIIIPQTCDQKTIDFKLSKNLKQAEKIKSTDIKSISVQSEDGNNYYFERLPIAKKPGVKPSKPYWLIILVPGYATLYTAGSSYITDEKGNVTACVKGSAVASFYYYVKKGDQNIAHFFIIIDNTSLSFGYNVALKKAAERYLYDYPELIERIKNKEFSRFEVEGIFRIYNDYMKNNKPAQQL